MFLLLHVYWERMAIYCNAGSIKYDSLRQLILLGILILPPWGLENGVF